MHAFLTLVSSCLLVSCAQAPSSDPVLYTIAFPNAEHHEAEVSVTFQGVPDGPLEVRMSRSSPGRYALHEFAKNVYDVRAVDGAGDPLEITRPDPHQWDVRGHDGVVRVTYTLYGDRADGTYSGIDRSHAHLNMPATFMWARGMEGRPMELTVSVPAASGWRVATQLAPTDDPYTFTAPHLQYFLDSPTEVSDFGWREWRVGDQTFRVALHHTGTEAELDAYAEATEKIVAAAGDVFGEFPRFDHGTYTFLACYLPWAAGDGMEHRNSTVLTSTGSLERNMIGLLGTVAHEFFHSWNVERIRPASLEPFDFEEANMSRELWFAEGFTSYFDDLILWRAGLLDTEGFAARLGGMVNAVTNGPGRAYFSPVEMSMQAPFVDAARSVDPQNKENTFISYYTWGSAVALGLDLSIRERWGPDVTLDHVMREMWTRFGPDDATYTVEDVESAVAAVTGEPAFAEDFFRRYVHGREVPPYGALLAVHGMELVHAGAGVGSLTGARLVDRDGGVLVASNTLVGDPLHGAGVDRDDVIVSASVGGGRAMAPLTAAALARAVEAAGPGAAVTLEVRSRGQTLQFQATLAESTRLSVRPFSGDDATRSRLEAWRASTPGGDRP